MKTVRVGIIDSGLHESLLASVAAQARFSGAEGDPLPVEPTRLAHGSDVARLVLQGCPSARLYNAQVFDRRLDASVDAVVLALGWLVAQGVDLVNMSFGIPTASQALEAACWEAHRAGVLLVAAAPARGGPVHPAACRACMAVSGDARCGPGEVAWLGMQEADFGVHPFRVDGCLSAGEAPAMRPPASVARSRP